MTLRMALCVATTMATIAGSAWAQTPPIDPAREMREVRIATIMINNLFDEALAALANDDCERLEKIKAQLSGFSESPNAIAVAIGSGPNEISQQKLIELSASAGARREALREPCPRTAAASQPGQRTPFQSSGSGGTDTRPSSPTGKKPVIIITGFDKKGGWISGDFGHTRTYIETMETTEHNPVIDDDELPPPVVECTDGRCRLNQARMKAAAAAQEGTKNQKPASGVQGGTEPTTKGALKDAAAGGAGSGSQKTAKGGVEDKTKGAAPATGTGSQKTAGLEKATKGGSESTKGGPEKATKAGSDAVPQETKSAEQQQSGGGQVGVGKAADVPPVQTAAAMAWLFLDEKFDSPMARIDPPNLKMDGPVVTSEQGSEQMKVVDAAQALMRDAYTAALDGVVHDDFAIYVLRHAMSDAGISFLSAQTLGKSIQLSPTQLAALRNFGEIRIKDLQLTAPDAQAGSQTGGASKSSKQSTGSGKTPAKTSKTTKTPTQTSKAPAQTNEAASQLGNQIMQGVIQSGVNSLIGRAMGGGDRRSHGEGGQMMKKSNAQTVKQPTTTSTQPSGGNAPSGPILFQGYTYPQR